MRDHALRALAVIALVLCALLSAAPGAARAADTGWTITSFDVRVQIQQDGRIVVNENLVVDFGSLQKHGIFRYIPVKYDWPTDARKVRVYEMQVLSVSDARGRPVVNVAPVARLCVPPHFAVDPV